MTELGIVNAAEINGPLIYPYVSGLFPDKLTGFLLRSIFFYFFFFWVFVSWVIFYSGPPVNLCTSYFLEKSVAQFRGASMAYNSQGDQWFV